MAGVASTCELVQSASPESGLIQIAAEILERSARGGILGQEDAFEYLPNNREAWNLDVDEDGEEPLEYLLKKLDNTILGLVEALDTEADDLPRLTTRR
jgi:hypothetical protein